jgi:hypothetical protein
MIEIHQSWSDAGHYQMVVREDGTVEIMEGCRATVCRFSKVDWKTIQKKLR